MKKALNITIAGILFTIEEDAFNALDSYLKSIQAHFGSDPDRAEIIKDIEARIAEQLMERQGEGKIVTIEAVEATMSVMGRVEDFNKEESDSAPVYEAKRRLYRNPDDAVIAGVCSGIAAYFGLDPFVVRLTFAILVLLGFGTGVVLYIIMALVVPKAETPAEKLQMKGGPIRLSSFKEQIEEQMEDVKKNSSGLRAFIERLFNLFGRVIRKIFSILRWVFGIGFLGGAILAVIALTFGFVNLIVNKAMIFREYPITDAVSDSVYVQSVGNAYLLVLIPLIFIGALGFRILTKRSALNTVWATGLGALWIIGLIVFGSMAIKHGPAIAEQAKVLDEERMEEWLGEPLPPLDELYY